MIKQQLQLKQQKQRPQKMIRAIESLQSIVQIKDQVFALKNTHLSVLLKNAPLDYVHSKPQIHAKHVQIKALSLKLTEHATTLN